jgi:hypothetical protein
MEPVNADVVWNPAREMLEMQGRSWGCDIDARLISTIPRDLHHLLNGESQKAGNCGWNRVTLLAAVRWEQK